MGSGRYQPGLERGAGSGSSVPITTFWAEPLGPRSFARAAERGEVELLTSLSSRLFVGLTAD